jgi:hypothetical protein
MQHWCVDKPRILIVEGEEDKLFFEIIMQQMDLLANYQIIHLGGEGNINKKEFASIFNTSGFFDRVEKVAVIRDSDKQDAGKSAFQSVFNVIQLSSPSAEELSPSTEASTFSNSRIQVGIFVMPGASCDGTMLEDLCLIIASDQEVVQCIESLCMCVKKIGAYTELHPKAKMKLFLSIVGKYDSKLKDAFHNHKNLFDLQSDKLSELKSFLQEFAK